MHMGSLATIGQKAPDNFKHIIINNGAHDSVGGQPTDAKNHEGFSFPKIALACGYKAVSSLLSPIVVSTLKIVVILASQAYTALTRDEICMTVKEMREEKGPVLLEVKTKAGGRKNLGRPTTSPAQNKANFMHFLAIHWNYKIFLPVSFDTCLIIQLNNQTAI